MFQSTEWLLSTASLDTTSSGLVVILSPLTPHPSLLPCPPLTESNQVARGASQLAPAKGHKPVDLDAMATSIAQRDGPERKEKRKSVDMSGECVWPPLLVAGVGTWSG